MNRYERAEQYANHLHDKGFTATVTLYGDVRFATGPREYVLSLHDENDKYIKLTRTFWYATTPDEQQYAADAARMVGRTSNGAHITIDNGTVSAVVETTLPSRNAFSKTSWLYIAALENSAEKFIALMRTSMPRPPVIKFPPTKRDRVEAHCSYLTSMGYTAYATPLDAVKFIHEGRVYTILLHDTNDHELELATSTPLAQITSDAKRARAATVAKNVTDIHPRVAISATPTGEVHASVHVYLTDPMTIGERFDDCFYELATAVERFTTQMAETKG